MIKRRRLFKFVVCNFSVSVEQGMSLYASREGGKRVRFVLSFIFSTNIYVKIAKQFVELVRKHNCHFSCSSNFSKEFHEDIHIVLCFLYSVLLLLSRDEFFDAFIRQKI